MRRDTTPILFECGVAAIPLTRERYAFVDVDDLPLVSEEPWCAKVDRGRVVYAVRTDVSGPRPRNVLMHRKLMGEPPFEGALIDHINRDGLDNRRANLRWVRREANNWNLRTRVDRTSGYTGVYRNGARWGAKIRFRGKIHHLGQFASEEEAGAAYQRAYRKRLSRIHDGKDWL